MTLNIYQWPQKLLHIFPMFFGLMICLWCRESEWVLVAVGFVTVSWNLFDLGKQLEYSVPLPLLMVFNYLFMHFFVSLILYFFPPILTYDIDHSRYPAYLAYVIPCCLALYLGVCLAEPSALKREKPISETALPVWARYSKQMFWFGVSAFYMGSLFDITSLNFIFELLANLRYVGLFAMILSGAAGWWRYAAFLFVVEFVWSTTHAMFGNLALWGGAFFLVLAFQYKWRRKAVLGLVGGLFILVVFQAVKVNFREFIWDRDLSVTEKATTFGDQFAVQLLDAGSIFEPEVLSTLLVRYNQGWIVDRVMEEVPSETPYAAGETIWEGLYAAFVPRLIDPEKPVAGGVKNFERFTGITLGPNTAMTIGVVGELYANFGVTGGIIGMGVFGFAIGTLYRMLQNKGAFHPAWYAWGPFIFFYAMKAEEGLMEITTWIVKSGFVMVLVIFLIGKVVAVRKKKAFAHA